MSSTRAPSISPAFTTGHGLPSRVRISNSRSALQRPSRVGKLVTAKVATQATPALNPLPAPPAPPSRVVLPDRFFGGRGNSYDHKDVKTVTNPDALSAHLRAQAASGQITVLSCHSKSCASCRAAMPKFHKLAAAYTQTSAPVQFVQMDYSSNNEFCRSILGVNSLPFFAVFKGTEFVSGSAMGWKSLTSKLSSQIESNLASVPSTST